MGFPSWSSSTRHLSFRCPRAPRSSSRNESHGHPRRSDGAKTGKIFRDFTSPRGVQRARGACARRGPYRPADRARPRRGCLRHARWRRVSTSPEGEASGSDPHLRASPSADVRRPPPLETRCGAAPEALRRTGVQRLRLLLTRRLAGTPPRRVAGARSPEDGLGWARTTGLPGESAHVGFTLVQHALLHASTRMRLSAREPKPAPRQPNTHRGTARSGRPRSALRGRRHRSPGRGQVPLPDCISFHFLRMARRQVIQMLRGHRTIVLTSARDAPSSTEEASRSGDRSAPCPEGPSSRRPRRPHPGDASAARVRIIVAAAPAGRSAPASSLRPCLHQTARGRLMVVGTPRVARLPPLRAPHWECACSS